MRFVIKIVCCIYFFFPLGERVIHAQFLDTYTEKQILKAEEYIRLHQYDKAEKHLLSSLKSSKNKEDIWVALGKIYLQTQQFDAAVKAYENAIDDKAVNLDKYGLLAVDAYFKNQNYTEAEALFSKIIENPKWNFIKKQEYVRLQNQINAKELRDKNQNKGIVIENLGPAINDIYADYFPLISPNDSTLIFTTRIGGMNEDFYVAHKDTCMEVWYQAENMGYPPNTIRNEGTMCISHDQHYMILIRCEITSDNGRAEGGCDLYLSYKTEEGWSGGESFSEIINTPGFDGMPSLSSDNNTLYFVSDRPGGYGGLDIWKSVFVKGRWTEPTNLGPTINTAGNEISPYIAADDKTLFFASDKLIGLGGQDLFISRWNNGQWSIPENLGAPYNSPFDDMSLVVLPHGRKAYFSSNRPGGYGNMDLYSAFMIEKYQPQLVNYIYGFLTDSINDKPIRNGKIEIYDMANQLVKEVYSNKGDGSFFICLPPNQSFRWRYNSWDYPAMEQLIRFDYEQHYPPIDMSLKLIHWSDYERLKLKTFDQLKEDPYNTIEYYEEPTYPEMDVESENNIETETSNQNEISETLD